jgi:hypothetical protein
VNVNDRLSIDDEMRFAAVAADPALITDPAEATRWVGYLDFAIAAVKAQMDLALLKAATRLPSEEKQAWYRRAAYSLRCKEAERERLVRREQELRGVDPYEAERAAIELKRRRVEVEEERQWRRVFVRIVSEEVEATRFRQWVDKARAEAGGTA